MLPEVRNVLYDVVTTSFVRSNVPQFVMRAPLETIGAVFRLHSDAIRRIIRENDEKGECRIAGKSFQYRYETDYVIRRVSTETAASLMGEKQ